MDGIQYLHDCLHKALKMQAQDIFLKIGIPPRARVGGVVLEIPQEPFANEHAREIIQGLLNPAQEAALQKNKSADFAFSLPGAEQRFRANVFTQQGFHSVVIRTLWKTIPTFEELQLPDVLKKVALERSGIVLIGGPVSSGKSTTMNAMVDMINTTTRRHIVTIEDPVEYLHRDKQSVINQREIGQDTDDFKKALKDVVRQSPDVVVIGEMRDAETFSFAVAAAEVGRLVIATSHGRTINQMIDRILGFFPPQERDTILGQFYPNLTCFSAQRLLVQKDGKSMVPAMEILVGNYMTRQLIHEKKFDKLEQAMRNGEQEGMQAMDQSILKLWDKGLISQEVALAAAERPQEIENHIKGIRIDGHSSKILGK